MLDTVSDLQVVLVIVWLMAIFAVGGRYVYRVGQRRLRRWRVAQVKQECAVPTYARLVSSRPQPQTTSQTPGRSGPRLTRPRQQSDYSPYVEDGLYTRVVRFPSGDVA